MTKFSSENLAISIENNTTRVLSLKDTIHNMKSIEYMVEQSSTCIDGINDSIKYLKNKGIKLKVIELSDVPKTAKDVERIYGCPLHQVLKTLLFIGNEYVLAVIPGDKRVDINKLKSAVNQQNLRLAKPNEIEEITGYTIGGICPFAIDNKNIIKVIDDSVFDMETVNIGSGKAEIGIELTTKELKKIWDGIIWDVVE